MVKNDAQLSQLGRPALGAKRRGRLHAVLGGLMLNVFARSSHFLSRLPYSLH